MMEGADHGLSDESMQQAYSVLLVNWLREMVQGARADVQATPVVAKTHTAVEAA